MQISASPLPEQDFAFPEATVVIGARERIQPWQVQGGEAEMLVRVHQQAVMFGERLLYRDDVTRTKQWFRRGHEGPRGAELSGVLVGLAFGETAHFVIEALKPLTERTEAGLWNVLSLGFRHHPFQLEVLGEHQIQFARCQLWSLTLAEETHRPVPSMAQMHAFQLDWPQLVQLPAGQPICQYMFRVWEEPYPFSPKFGAILRREPE